MKHSGVMAVKQIIIIIINERGCFVCQAQHREFSTHSLILGPKTYSVSVIPSTHLLLVSSKYFGVTCLQFGHAFPKP